MGIIGAAFEIAFVLGGVPPIGGFARTGTVPQHRRYVAAGLSVLNFVSPISCCRESLHVDLRATRPLLDLSHLPRALRHEKLAPLMWAWASPRRFAG